MQDDHADVVVVGAGPAGLAAATELRRHGLGRVVVLDREAQAGGIPRHCGHYPFGMREFQRVLRGPDYSRRLVDRALKAGVEIRCQTTVTHLGRDGRLDITMPEGPAQIQGRAVLLATGVREASRAQRLIGGEKPAGVLSTGALQGLVYLDKARPFRNPVIVGTELVAFSALLTCRHAGIKPVAMIESGTRTTARSALLLLARSLGVPVLFGTELDAILGRERVAGVLLRDENGQREIPADGVIVTGGFRPEASLLQQCHLAADPATGGPAGDRFGRLSDPAYFAAGNVLRAVETAGWCWSEGVRAAYALAMALHGRLPPPGDLRLRVNSDAIKYAVPQILLPGADHTRLQIRLTRPARGLLRLMQGETCLASRRIDGLPERRIIFPLGNLDRQVHSGAAIRLELEEG